MSIVLCTEEIQPIVDKLIAHHPLSLSEVDSSRVLLLRGKGKRRPVTIASVRAPWNLCTAYKYVLTVHGPKFDKLDENKQAIAIFDELLRIKEFENSTLKPHSIVGNMETLAAFGLEWLEADECPLIFNDQEQKKA